MNSRDLISDLPLGPGDRRAALLQARLIFRYLADHVEEARLGERQRLCDATDFKAWLRELAEEVRKIGNLSQDVTTGLKVFPPAPQKRYGEADWCPDCGHIHADDEECGFPIGGGRKCRCERAVVA
jgi:hypothetical protein